MSRARRGLAALAALAVLVVLPPPAARADADDPRTRAIAEAMAEGRVYVEPALAGGDADRWADRLQSALDRIDFPTPVSVAAWTASDVIGPSTPFSDDARAWTRLGVPAGVRVFAVGSGARTLADGQPQRVLDRAAALDEAAGKVRGEAARIAGRDEADFLPVAEVWAWLRLAAADPPTERALAAELAADDAVFVDTTPSPFTYSSDRPLFDPTGRASLIVIGLIVAGYLGFRGYRAVAAWRTPDAEEDPGAEPPPSPLLVSAAEVERRVTELAVAISERPAAPGTLGYDRAQACSDAAERYADRDAERDRIGAVLLCRDGQRWLRGEPVERRCYFNPAHLATGAVKRDGVAVPCCAACALQIRAGRAPLALRVAAAEGDPRRPYYEVADSWTRTGYGALSEDWAEQVLRESLR